ncbi:MAG: NUDIX hydrolase [Pseudonocardiaceae bacterium]
MAQRHDRAVPCVGAVVFDHRGRLLLVKRVNEPGKGGWSLPGGRIEAGETAHQAVSREVAEETGLDVEATAYLGNVQCPAPGGAVFDIQDYSCRVLGGTLRAGDDADAARWCDAAALALLPVVDGLIEALTEWDALPR